MIQVANASESAATSSTMNKLDDENDDDRTNQFIRIRKNSNDSGRNSEDSDSAITFANAATDRTKFLSLQNDNKEKIENIINVKKDTGRTKEILKEGEPTNTAEWREHEEEVAKANIVKTLGQGSVAEILKEEKREKGKVKNRDKEKEKDQDESKFERDHRNSNHEKTLKEEQKDEATKQSTQPSFPNLRALVVGLEHSGTTITGRLIMNAPCIIGATETGYLLAKTPGEIHRVRPWFEWHSAERGSNKMMYRLQPNDIDDMKNAKDFMEMYDILRHRSHLFNDLNDEKYCDRPYQMVDKTPRYIYPEYFEMILERTPNVPVIVLQRPFESLEKSWAQRKSVLRRDWYDLVFDNVDKMRKKYPKRIFVLQYNELMDDPDLTMTNVFEFLGLKWDHQYFKMTGLKKKFLHYDGIPSHLAELEFEVGRHSPDIEKQN